MYFIHKFEAQFQKISIRKNGFFFQRMLLLNTKYVIQLWVYMLTTYSLLNEKIICFIFFKLNKTNCNSINFQHCVFKFESDKPLPRNMNWRSKNIWKLVFHRLTVNSSFFTYFLLLRYWSMKIFADWSRELFPRLLEFNNRITVNSLCMFPLNQSVNKIKCYELFLQITVVIKYKKN